MVRDFVILFEIRAETVLFENRAPQREPNSQTIGQSTQIRSSRRPQFFQPLRDCGVLFVTREDFDVLYGIRAEAVLVENRARSV